MRNQMAAMAAIALLTASAQALAAEPAKPEAAKPAKPEAAKAEAAKAPADKSAPSAPMTAPKPAPENDMFKKSSGTWNCEGSAKGPDGSEMKFKSSWTIKSILGGHWYSVVYKRSKMGPLPAFEGNGTIGYSQVDKKYWFVGFDTFGSWINLTSTDNSVYAGEGAEMGKKVPVKFTFTPGKDKKGQESDKLFDVTMDFGPSATSHENCKK
jgi:nucleoid-associated protein YgaU